MKVEQNQQMVFIRCDKVISTISQFIIIVISIIHYQLINHFCVHQLITNCLLPIKPMLGNSNHQHEHHVSFTPRPSNMSVVGDFDPYKNPPSFTQAKDHAKAKRIGKIPSGTYGLRICPCCQNIINNEEFQLGVDSEELIELGIGYPLFYEIYKYFIILIGIILLVSGGTFYYLITKDCVEHCYYFLGFVIINLEISAEQTVKKTTVLYAITSFVLFFSCIIIKRLINRRIYELEQSTINPSQYSILLQNLPQKITKQEILNWSFEVFNERPIEIHIIYDSNELLDSIDTKNALTIEYNRQQIFDREMVEREGKDDHDDIARYSHMEAVSEKENILREIDEQNAIISKYNTAYQSNKYSESPQSQPACTYPQTGSCILTFNNSQTANNIIINHEHSTFGYLARNVMTLFTNDPLTLKGNKVVVCTAPQPRQLLWKNMDFSFKRDFMFEVLFVMVMIGLMALAFKIQFAFVDYAFEQYSHHHINFVVMYEAFVMSVIIVCLNYLLRLIVKFLASINKPHSYTQQESRFCNYYTFLFILNACLTIYIVHGAAIKGNNQLLLYDIHLVMLTTALSGPLYKILNPRMIVRAAWRYYVSHIPADKNPYTQQYVNQLFEGEQATNADNYQYIYRMLFINVWFASIAPLGLFFTLVIMIADYWVTKYLLVRMNSQSKILSIEISKPLSFLELIPLIYIAGILPFILKISTTLSLEIFMNQFYTYGVVLIVLLIMVVVYLTVFYSKREFIPPMSYRQIELGFLHNYETENPLTRVTGQIHYLEKLLNSEKLKESEVQVVKNAIEAKKESYDLMSRKIVGLNRIKHKIQRRIVNNVNDSIKKQYGMDLKIQNSYKKIDFKNDKDQEEELDEANNIMTDTINESQFNVSKINHADSINKQF